MSAFGAALIADLSESDLDRLAELLKPRLAGRHGEHPGASPWLNVEAAAAYLSCPKSRVYALVSARRIPFHKDGSRTLFRREELDLWVRDGGARRP